MPGRENVDGSVDVTMVHRFALAARPFFCRISDPTSQTFQAFRASAPVTATIGLGGIGFVDFLEPHACDIAFILQHGSEYPPARVQNRFGLVRFRKSRGIHVANEDRTIALSEP